MTSAINGNTFVSATTLTHDNSGQDVGQMKIDLAALSQAIQQLNNDAAALNPPIANGEDLKERLSADLSTIQSLTAMVSGDIETVQEDAANGDAFASMTINKPAFRVMLAGLTGNVDGQGSLLGDTKSDSLANLLAYTLSSGQLTGYSAKISNFLNAH